MKASLPYLQAKLDEAFLIYRAYRDRVSALVVEDGESSYEQLVNDRDARQTGDAERWAVARLIAFEPCAGCTWETETTIYGTQSRFLQTISPACPQHGSAKR